MAKFLAFLLQTMGWSYVVGEYMIHICSSGSALKVKTRNHVSAYF